MPFPKYDREEVRKIIKESPITSAVYIGCDSRRFRHMKRWFAAYSAVVVIHQESSKGCRVFHSHDVQLDYGDVRTRMINEVNYAVQMASDIADVVGDRKFEIHLDINPDPVHASNKAMTQAVGYVKGMGYIPRIKPNAPIASTAADYAAQQKYRVPRHLLGK